MLMNLEDNDSEFGTWFVQCTYFILCVQWGIFWELLKMWQFVEVGRFSFQIKICVVVLVAFWGNMRREAHLIPKHIVWRFCTPQEWKRRRYGWPIGMTLKYLWLQSHFTQKEKKKRWVNLSWERWKYLDNLENMQFFEKVLMSWLIIINFLGVIW